MNGGWGWPGAAKKAHYFADGGIISLCRRWMYRGPLTVNQEGASPDDCVACTRELAKLTTTALAKRAEL
jgi:hypothetical protein